MTIEQRIIDSLQELFPTHKFVLSWRNGVEPKSVYCLVMLLNEKQIGRSEETSYLDDEENTSYTETLEATVRLQYMGLATSSAYQDSKTAKLTLASHKGRSCLYRNGLSFQRIEGVTRAGVSRDTNMYVANVIDLTVAYTETISVESDYIEEIEIGSSLTSQDLPPPNQHPVFVDITIEEIFEDVVEEQYGWMWNSGDIILFDSGDYLELT